VLGVLVALEQGQTPATFEKLGARLRAHAVAEQIPGHCRAFYWMAVGETLPLWAVHLDAMWAQMLTGKPTLNGWSGSVPHGWPLWGATLSNHHERAPARQALKRWIATHGLPRETTCLVLGRPPGARGR
jgi:hypothetical protein